MFQQTHLSFRVWTVWDLSGPRRSRRDGDPHTRQDCHLHRVLPIYLLPSPASHSRFVSRQRTFPPAKGPEASVPPLTWQQHLATRLPVLILYRD